MFLNISPIIAFLSKNRNSIHTQYIYSIRSELSPHLCLLISSLYLSTLTFRLNLLSFVDVAVHLSTLALYTSQVQIFEDILFQGTTNAKNNLCTNDISGAGQPSNLFEKKKHIENVCVLTSDYRQNEIFLSISVILKKMFCRACPKLCPLQKPRFLKILTSK